MQEASADGYMVKGSSLLSKIDFVRERFKSGAADKLAQDLAGWLGRVPLATQWYPFSIYEQLLKAIADRFFGGDLSRLREIGTFSAASALGGSYQAFSTKDFRKLVSRLTRLHSLFYTSGRLEVEFRPDGLGCEIRQFEVPRASAADDYLARGFYEACASTCGLVGVSTETLVRPGGSVFRLRWTSPPVA